jgi:uncharacterized protein YfaS (alpha-2-macroglobulin family)
MNHLQKYVLAVSLFLLCIISVPSSVYSTYVKKYAPQNTVFLASADKSNEGEVFEEMIVAAEANAEQDFIPSPDDKFDYYINLLNDDSARYTSTNDYLPRSNNQRDATNDAVDRFEEQNKDDSSFAVETGASTESKNELEVISIIPNDTDVTTNTDIAIVFNQPIAELGTIDSFDDKDFGITVDPPFPFRVRLAGTSTLKIEGQMPADVFKDGNPIIEGDIEHRLPRSARIKFTIPKGLQSLSGTSLSEAVEFELTTPQIDNAYGPSGLMNPFTTPTIRFTQPVDITKLEAKISVSDQNGTIPVRLRYNENETKDMTRVEILPESKFWGYDKDIKIEVDKGVFGTEGNLPTTHKKEHNFMSIDFIRIGSTPGRHRSTESLKMGIHSNLYIQFDYPPISKEEIQQALKINGSSDFTFEYEQICIARDEETGACSEYEDDEDSIIVHTADVFDYEDEIEMTLDPIRYRWTEKRRLGESGETLLAKEGEIFTTDTTIRRLITIAPKPEILGHRVLEDDLITCLYTNANLSSDSVKNNLKITPSPYGAIRVRTEKTDQPYPQTSCARDDSPGEYTIEITAKLPIVKEVTFEIDGATEDEFGVAIQSPYIFTRKGGSLEHKDISISSRQDLGFNIVHDAKEPVVSFTTMNVPDGFWLDVCRIDPLSYLKWREQHTARRIASDPQIMWHTCDDTHRFLLEVAHDPWQEQQVDFNVKEQLGENYKKGFYIFSAHHPLVYNIEYSQRGLVGVENDYRIRSDYSNVSFLQSDLSLIGNADDRRSILYVANTNTGLPAAEAIIQGIRLTLSSDDRTKVTTYELGTSDKNGYFEYDDSLAFDYLLITSDDDRLLTKGLHWFSERGPETRSYAFTDRSLYLPGDTVKGKAIFFTRENEKLQYIQNAEATIELQTNDEPVEQMAITNEHGAIAFEVELPIDIETGYTRIKICIKNQSCHYTEIRVEEYKKPEIELEIKTDRKKYYEGDAAEITLAGSYFYGAPVRGGNGYVKITRKSEYEWGRDYYEGCPRTERVLTEHFEFDEDGLFKVPLKIDFSEIDCEGLRFEYVIEASIDDRNKTKVHQSTSFQTYREGGQIKIEPQKNMIRTDESTMIRIRVFDETGKPLINAPLELRHSYKNKRISLGDEDHMDKSDTPFRKEMTDVNGVIEYEFTPILKSDGEYKISAELIGDDGMSSWAEASVYAYNQDTVFIDKAKRENIVIEADKDEYAVGETITLKVRSPLAPSKSKYMFSQKRSTLRSAEVMEIDQSRTITLTATEKMIPNTFFTLEGVEFGDNHRFATGKVEVNVSRDYKTMPIKVGLPSDIEPGEEVTINITTDTANGELAVVVVDQANLALLESTHASMLNLFFPTRKNTVKTLLSARSWFKNYSEMKPLRKSSDNHYFFDESISSDSEAVPTGGGGDDVSGSTGVASHVRKNFADTAYFKGILKTNSTGEASVTFTAPDNLTTWSVMVMGIDDRFRANTVTKQFTAQKPLLILPQLPRFARVNDTIELRADVHNNSRSDQLVRFTVSVENAKLGSAEEEPKTIPANTAESFVIPISLEHSTAGQPLKIMFTAEGDEVSDSVQLEIPVLQYASPETVATSGVTNNTSFPEKLQLTDDVVPNIGSAKITTSATMAHYLSSSLEEITNSRFSSTRSDAENLMLALTLKRALALPGYQDVIETPTFKNDQNQELGQDEAIQYFLSRLLKSQSYAGWWNNWSPDKGDVNVTGTVFEALLMAREANLLDDEELLQLERTYEYLTKRLQSVGRDATCDYDYEKEIIHQPYLLLSLLAKYDAANQKHQILLETVMMHCQAKTSPTSVLYLVEFLQRGDMKPEVLDSLQKYLKTKIIVDQRGMNLGEQLGTALFVKNQIRTSAKTQLYTNPYIEKMLRWLITTRKNGLWQNHHTTRVALATMTDFLEKSEEAGAVYTAKVFVNEALAKQYQVQPNSFFDKHVLTLLNSEILNAPDSSVNVQFAKEGSEAGAMYYDIVMRYFLPITKFTPRVEGIAVTRKLYRLDSPNESSPVMDAEVGEILRGEVEITMGENREYVAVEVQIPAGTELINFAFDIADQDLKKSIGAHSGSFNHTEIRNNRLILYANNLSSGTHKYRYALRATHRGIFHHPPAYAEAMETPEIFGRSAGEVFTVRE